MAVPKKKVSRSRRDKRRNAPSNGLKTPIRPILVDGVPSRTHRVPLAVLDQVLAEKNAKE